MKKKIMTICAAVLFLTALGLTLYPLISSYVNQKYASEIQTAYQELIQQTDDSVLQEAKQRAVAYNLAITPGTADAYSEESLLSATENYDDQLDVAGNGIMGYVEIPNYLYVDNSGSFRSVVNNGLISSDTIQALSKNVDEAVNRQANQRNTEATRAAYPASALVTYSDYIINNMPFGNNVNGTCGSVAAGMMLTYVDNKVLTKGTVVPSEIGYGEDLHQSLIPYCEGSNGSTSASVSTGINDWLNNNENEYGVSKIITAHYFYVAYHSYAKQSIANGKPVVLALGNVLGSPYGNHQVLAFGYYSNANGNYYNAHIGWSGAGYSNAVIDSSWAIGVCYVG